VTALIAGVKVTAKANNDLIGRHAKTLADLKRNYALLAQAHSTALSTIKANEALSMRKIARMEVWRALSTSCLSFHLPICLSLCLLI
jgi:hypothetical protein